jgi:predicted solute-binding protein
LHRIKLRIRYGVDNIYMEVDNIFKMSIIYVVKSIIKSAILYTDGLKVDSTTHSRTSYMLLNIIFKNQLQNRTYIEGF